MKYLIRVDEDPENPRHIFPATELLKKRTDMRPYYGPVVIGGKVVRQDVPKSEMNVIPPGIAKPLSLESADLVDQSNAERELARQVRELEAENEALYKEIGELKEKLASYETTEQPAGDPPAEGIEGAQVGVKTNEDAQDKPDDLQTMIIEAIKAIQANPEKDDLTNAGQVKVRAIEKRLGINITSDDRDKAVEAMKQ